MPIIYLKVYLGLLYKLHHGAASEKTEVFGVGAPLHVFLLNRFSAIQLCSKKKGEVLRAPKAVIHKLHVFRGATPQWSS
jgi:hypothetical protein